MPKISLTSRQKKLWKSKEPSDFFLLFNEIHNSHLMSTNVGRVSVKVDGKKKNNNK